ncbi:MAG: hypothetical protein GXP41_11610 [Chloroflexi bacterium]|nr:hypothetical protein [Chloroflexota bacterium]
MRIAVVGGGPAGALFACFAFHYARQIGHSVSVSIFEPRDFSRAARPGCNMCAGLIPVHVLDEFADIGIFLPPRVIRSLISDYSLHMSAGTLDVAQPDKRASVVSVFRGNGPIQPPPEKPISLDAFLLGLAIARGAQLRPVPVRAIEVGHSPRLRTAGDEEERYDLIVLASGVNGPPLQVEGIPYRPPKTRIMAQTEIFMSPSAIQKLQGRVHIFLPSDSNLTFGTLVPKKNYVSISLLGNELPPGSISRFLAQPEVTAQLGVQSRAICACRPRISVSPADPLYGPGFVAVGDAGVTRLYKNGIGSALRTARAAARTAIFYGPSGEAFNRGYNPLCRAIIQDNRFGRFLFLFVHVLQHNSVLAHPHLMTVKWEQRQPPRRRRLSRLVWGMFTGSDSYRRLFAVAIDPRIQYHLLICLIADTWYGRDLHTVLMTKGRMEL